MEELSSKFWSFNRSEDAAFITREEIVWKGPFSWKGFESKNNLAPLPDLAAVYLFTFEYKDGYILRGVGVTKSTKRRFAQHTREYRNGNYTVLDVRNATIGLRKEVWHGWEYAKTHRDEFICHKEYIMNAVDQELQAYRVFIAQIDDRRKRERIEYAIMHNVYASKMPWADLADGCVALRGRANDETPIEMLNISPCKIYGLAELLEI